MYIRSFMHAWALLLLVVWLGKKFVSPVVVFYIITWSWAGRRVDKAIVPVPWKPVGSSLRPAPYSSSPCLAPSVCTSYRSRITVRAHLFFRTILLFLSSSDSLEATKKTCLAWLFFLVYFVFVFVMNGCLHCSGNMCVDLLVLLNYFGKKKKEWQGFQPEALSGWRN